MEVYRLCREKHAGELSGKGAALYGARWNSPGIEMIYTATNRALAMAEVAVHFSWATLPADYVMITVHIPDRLSAGKINPASLPANWRHFPPLLDTQKTGDRFIQQAKHCLLQVPSAVVQGDFNILINPAHPDFSHIRIKKIETFAFDSRLFK